MIETSTIHLVAALIGALAILVLALAIYLPQAAARSGSGSNVSDQKTFSPLSARIPISEIRDDLIVRRDGSFCAGWECSGIATQFASLEKVESVSSALDAFIKGIRHPEVELQFRYLIDRARPHVLQDRM